MSSISSDTDTPTINPETEPRRGLMLALSSPSGAGKSTISRALLETEDNLVMSVSATTRPMRPGEIEGKDYYFMDHEKFRNMVEKREFLEYATVFDNSYGTPRGQVDEALHRGNDVLFDVDWQGTQQIAQNAGEDLVSIFILPPSIEELEKRLYSRAQDSEEVVKSRMSKASSEMSHWDAYDYVIINDEIDKSISSVRDILQVERRRRRRQPWLVDFVRSLGVGQ